MSQALLFPPSPVSLPPITYKGQPVVTTEMLAQAYGCEVANIRQNFTRNRDRFIEGKHFYSLQSGELKEFRDLCVTNCHTQISMSTKARSLTLWLERGAARHAKMLNTDRAWDVFEMLEETFFRVVKPAPALESTVTPSTAADRKPLRSLVYAWSQVAGVPVNACWPQVRAHFQLSRIDDLPVEWIPDALAFVQGKVDALQKALPAPAQEQKALPPASGPEYYDLMAKFADSRENMNSTVEDIRNITHKHCGEKFVHTPAYFALELTSIAIRAMSAAFSHMSKACIEKGNFIAG